MNTRLLSRLAVFALAVLVLASVLTAAAAANFVPVTRADDLSLGERTAEQLKPPECTMYLANIVQCTGTARCSGTGVNDLILGTSGDDENNGKISGGDGNDCILGGAGNDDISGDDGNDYILGGAGNDN
ncbi:MAG: hypothetical protein IMZ73_13560, partial [Chloroflexi bacterium]|nr:hypothetical protein [Chloroflexota bacterium]